MVPFPEDRFPPPAVLREAYEARVAAGYARLRETRLLIWGLARDLGARLVTNTLPLVESIRALAAESSVVVFENDSQDSTRGILRDWAQRDPRVVVLSVDTGRPRWRSIRSNARGDHMAEYRNVVRDLIASPRVLETYDYAIALDLDIEGVSLDGLADTFGRETSWDAMISSGLEAMPSRARPGTMRLVQYDAWAFRRYGAPHEPLHCSEVHPLVPSRGDSLLRIASGFGGMGVYPAASVVAARYAGGDIEHTAFHAALDRVYLNPSQIVLYR